MKNLLFLLIGAIVGASLCYLLLRKNESSGSTFDLSHYYEPHITAIHKNSDPTKHFYSVMMVVKNGQNVYIDEDNSQGSKYDIAFTFNEVGKPLSPLETFPLNSDYELQLYDFQISNLNNMANYEESIFRAVVNDPPTGHPHDHPKTLHLGTVHKPGFGGKLEKNQNE
ncbi:MULTISPECIES: hypothetical protein [unclassified Ekhidna]|jgi:hypothetical protein|uniref:hypothetical protein n=1 Tax=unclassified Ekhidna TaxID=2632188 RepID=UPI0032DE2C76